MSTICFLLSAIPLAALLMPLHEHYNWKMTKEGRKKAKIVQNIQAGLCVIQVIAFVFFATEVFA